MWLALAAMMFLLYALARKAYTLDTGLILRMGMLLTMSVVFFLPHMHERYAILVDVMAIVFAFYNPRKFYVPVLTILCSFAGYTVYLAQNNVIPMYVYALIFMGLMADHAVAVYQRIFVQE